MRGGRIDRIVSSQENYEFEYDDLRLSLDETPYRFPIVPHTVKDWIAALSIWLETDNLISMISTNSSMKIQR